MTDKTRIAIAAATTAAFLGGVSALGLATRSDDPAAGDQAARQAGALTVADPGGTREAAAGAREAPAPAPAFGRDDDHAGDEGWDHDDHDDAWEHDDDEEGHDDD